MASGETLELEKEIKEEKKILIIYINTHACIYTWLNMESYSPVSF